MRTDTIISHFCQLCFTPLSKCSKMPRKDQYLRMSTRYRYGIMVRPWHLKLDGKSEIVAHECGNLCYLICLRHLIRSKAVKNRFSLDLMFFVSLVIKHCIFYSPLSFSVCLSASFANNIALMDSLPLFYIKSCFFVSA